MPKPSRSFIPQVDELSDSIPRLEMELEELLEKRNHESTKPVNQTPGCFILLLCGAIFSLLAIFALVQDLTSLLVFFFGTFLSLGAIYYVSNKRTQIKHLEFEIHRRRERIVKLKESQNENNS